MIKTNDLNFLHEVLNSRSITQAAKALGTSQSAVSQRLAGLEKRIGVSLLDRSGTLPIRTEEGEITADTCSEILYLIDALNDNLSIRRHAICGDLRVTAPLGFGRKFIAPLIAEFVRLHPELNIDLTLSDRMGRHPATSFDVLICVGQLPETALILRNIATNRQVVCASPDFIRRHGVPATPAELNNFPCIALREDDQDERRWDFSREDEAHHIVIKPKFVSNDGEVTSAWALRGMGIIARSQWNVSSYIRSGELVEILPGYHLPDNPVTALFASHKNRTRRVRAFADYLTDHLSPAPWVRDMEPAEI